MRSTGVLVVVLACAASARAQVGCPREPSLDPSGWMDAREGLGPPDEREARARVRELEAGSDVGSSHRTWQLAEAYRAMYRVSHDRADLERSVREYARTIQGAPRHPRMDTLLYRLGQALDQLQQPDRARPVYHRLIRAFPRSPHVADAYLSFGDHYFSTGDFDAASRFYERAAQLDSGVTGAYASYMAAWCHLRLGDASAARRSADAAREMIVRAPGPAAAILSSALSRDRCALAP